MSFRFFTYEVRGETTNGDSERKFAHFGFSLLWAGMWQSKGGQGLGFAKLKLLSCLLSFWFDLAKDDVDISHVSEKKMLDYAGNAMHLPCVGFALLCAIVALRPVSGS